MQLKMKRPTQFLILILIVSALVQNGSSSNATVPIDVGVVLDVGTLVGKTGLTSISMAMDDFYSLHNNYTTRLVFHPMDSNSNTIDAVSAALELMKNVQVEAIIGPQKSDQAVFISELGNKTQVPIISFSATSPSLTSHAAPYFVRVAANDSSQAYAISSIIKAFGWREVVPIYEDTNFGTGFIPYLIDALYGVDAQVPYRSVLPLSVSDDRLLIELYKLMTMQTRVFIVHMSPSLCSRLFLKAKEVGMMSEGYVWIMTDGLTNLLDSMDPSVTNSMQGVLGVKQYMPETRKLADFTLRWERRFRKENPDLWRAELSIYGLWAYDATWALAMAAEEVRAMRPNFSKPQIVGNSSDLESLGVSQIGNKLLEAISRTEFAGLSGTILLIDGQLQSSMLQIINVFGKSGKEIGFWTPAHGISRDLNANGRKTYSTSTSDLGAIIWPGESMAVPKGWEIPVSGKKLRIGVPVKYDFVEFVKVEHNPLTNLTTISGYCIDIFEAALQKLPYAVSYEYIPFENTAGEMAGSYDDLVYQVYLQKYDAVVGDVTIQANRSLYVDFTLPFTESGVEMIVPVKEVLNKNAWIFLKPLTTDLWLGSLAFFFYTGFVVWVMEHRINKEFRGSPSQQLGIIFYFSFSTLVFAHREKVENILSKLVVIIWLFVVLILTSSYTASLTSMLTVEQLQPTVTDIDQLLKNGDYVGYDRGSFVEGLLKELNFSPSKIIPLDSSDSYVEALSKGSSHGGVSAIFQENPYIKLFLSQHCTGYTVVGPTQKTAGFGVVFPKGSPLVPDMSRAILNVTEGEIMVEIERKWFGDQACSNQGSTVTSQALNFRSFWGLFLLTGTTSACALLIFWAIFLYKNWHEIESTASENSFWQRFVAWARHYDKRDLKSPTFKRDHEHTSAVGNASICMRCSNDAKEACNGYGLHIPSHDIEEGRQIPSQAVEEGLQIPSQDVKEASNDYGLQSPLSLSNISHMNSYGSCEGSHSRELESPSIEAPIDR